MFLSHQRFRTSFELQQRNRRSSVFRRYYLHDQVCDRSFINCDRPEMERRILILLVVLSAISSTFSSERSRSRRNFECSGRPYYNVTMAAYYPDFTSDDDSDYLDARGKKLRILQDFLDGRTEYVTVAMDLDSGIPYGTKLCIPELNGKFERQIPLQARDRSHYSDVTMSSPDFSHVDICVRSEEDSYDNAVNGIVTLYVL